MSEMSDVQTVYVGRAQLYLFVEETGQYTEFGSVGCCIMGSPSTLLFKLGCYADSGEYHCTATITSNNEVGARIALQGNGYVSFKDENGKSWSLLFPSDSEAVEFAANATVAMYSASGSPEASIIACDVVVGKKDRSIFVNDKVKVRFRSWVVQRGSPGRDVSKLGSALESNEHDDKPYMLTVPANHVSVTSEMKGFEGMIVGACEEGQRVVVIPQNAKRGSGPNTHLCFYVSILKKKDESKLGGGGSNAFTAGNNNGMNYGSAVFGAQGNVGGYGNPQGALQLMGQPGFVALHQQPITHVPEPAPVVPPTVLPPAPPPPPPGFNSEQLMLVDRMRDQIQALTQQLKEATQKFDLLNNDFKVHQNKTKPTSLASAQLEYTIQKLIQDTDDLKEELSQRDGMLKQVEEKNRDLQRKVDRFTATANQLAEEKKGAINLGSEEKIDLDRRIAQVQAQLTRIQGEREDVARHLSTTKRLLEISDQDLKSEKGKYQVSLVGFQTNESKLTACEETLIEERSRRKLLESKCAVLADELRGLAESLRVKDGQMDERRRKMEADKLHYSQILEDERIQAAAELRELRQELIDELAIRDRRYQEERQRVAHESFERGRAQGVDDGHSEALLEADQKVQELVLSVQRNKSEVETMKIRLRQSREQADGDQRRLNAQISALQRTVDDLDAQNSATELEMDSLKSAKSDVESDAYDRIAAALRGLSRPVGKQDLLSIVHALRVHKNVDYSFEVSRDAEEADRLAIERQEVGEWLRQNLRGASVAFPAMRTRAPEEKALPYAGDVIPATHGGAVTELPNEVASLIAQKEVDRQEDVLMFDPEEMNRRYKQLLSDLDNDNPELGLIEKKPPPPPRPPTPPREPTPPPREPTPVQRDPTPIQREPTPQREPLPASKEASTKAGNSLPSLASSSDSDSDAGPQVRSAPTVPAPEVNQDDSSASGDDKAHEKTQAPQPAVERIPPPPRTEETDEESDAPPPKRSAPPVVQQRAVVDDDSEDDAPPPKRSVPSPSAKAATRDSDDDEPPAKPAQASPAPKAAPKKSSMFADSESDEEDSRVAKPVAPPKRAVPQQQKSKFADSDSDAAAPPKKTTSAPPKKTSAAPPKKKSMFADSEDSDAAPPPRQAAKKGPTAKASAAARKPQAPKKKSMFDDSEDD